MPIVKEIPAKAVVDSGPLFNVLALNYVRKMHELEPKRGRILRIRVLDLHAKPDSSHGVCELGPTDAGLIELSQSEGCILLTHDKNTLARHAWEVGARCELVRNVVGYYK